MMELPPLGPYVYLQSLYKIDQTYAEDALAHSTFNLNKTYDSNISNKVESHTVQPIIDAISQLENIAATEAVKEQYAINGYRKKIINYLASETNENPIPPELKKNLKTQLENLDKMDINSFKNNETNFINSFNITIQNINAYKRRLSELSIMKKNTEEIKEGFEQGAQSHVANFLLNRKSSSTADDKVRDAQLNRLIRESLKKLNLRLPQLENELYSLIFIDFTGWLANNPNETLSYEKLSLAEVTQLYDIYASQNQNSLTETHLYRLLRQAQDNDTQLKNILNDMQQTFKGTFLTRQEYNQYKQFVESELKEKEKNPKYNLHGKKINGNDYSFKQLNDLLETYEKGVTRKGKNKKYAFTLETKTSQGNFYEKLITIIRSAGNVSGNVAADLILPIATLTFTKNQQEQQKELMSLSLDMGKIITEHFNKTHQTSINKFNDLIEHQKDLHTKAQERINQSEINIQKISNLGEKFFIAHESTKLYRSAESKESNRVVDEFHGRKMKSMIALSKLYASNNLSNNMINSNELITFLINIHSDTLANQANLNPLETYLSIFAGLLMFDDIKEIADVDIKEIMNNLNGSTINQLHVYNLGGIYYPLSVILNNLIIQMKKGINDINQIDYSKTAIVKIYPPSTLSYKDGSIASWNTLANNTLHNTEIQIHFLQGFNNYIKDLFKQT